jgi:Peptidase M15
VARRQALRGASALAGRAALMVTAALAGGCAAPPPAADDFGAWRATQGNAVAALEAHLVQNGVAGVLPLPQLLRSASSWQPCGAAPWAMPPAAQWPAVVSVLQLLQALQREAVVGEITVHSGYRDAALNACAGGAARSAHLLGFAIDFTPTAEAGTGERLCAFWQRHGREWRMGLGRYASGRLHIDTAGFRAWGGSGPAAPCAASAPTPGAER